MTTSARTDAAAGIPLVARLHVDLCRCTSAVCCR
ncbi:putative leader peptide [Streptomyces genisteinicus]